MSHGFMLISSFRHFALKLNRLFVERQSGRIVTLKSLLILCVAAVLLVSLSEDVAAASPTLFRAQFSNGQTTINLKPGESTNITVFYQEPNAGLAPSPGSSSSITQIGGQHFNGIKLSDPPFLMDNDCRRSYGTSCFNYANMYTYTIPVRIPPTLQYKESVYDANWNLVQLTRTIPYGPMGINPYVSICAVQGATSADNWFPSCALSVYGSAPLVINVVSPNSPPEVKAVSATVYEDTQASINLTATDPDPGDTQTFSIKTNVNSAVGTAMVQGKKLVFNPRPNWNGTATLTYVATDIAGAESVPATATFTVLPVNDAPTASDATLAINEDTTGTLVLGVTDVDLTYEGDSHVWSIVTAPNAAHGTASISGNKLTFEPAINWFGTATLTYQVRDAAGVISNIATVTITVNPVNDPPVALNRSLTTAEDTAGTVALVASDIEGSSLTYSVEAQPNAAHGTVTIVGDKATFTPKPNWNGTTSFTYRAFDGADYSSPATVSVTVTPVNDAPAASNRALAINEDTTGTLVLGVTDVDLTFEGDSHAWSIVTPPNAAHGTATITGSTLTFKPALDWFGTATLTYRVRDAAGVYSNTATVTITVNPVNDAPVVISQDMTTDEDTSGTVTLGVTDVDPGDVHTFHVVDKPNSLHGEVTVTGNKATFTPALNWYGTATFTFVARDQVGATSNTGTVTVTVASVNDVPVAASPGVKINTKESRKAEVKIHVNL